MFCSNCGSRLADGAKFCSECGARVSMPEAPVVDPFEDLDFKEPEFTREPAADNPVVNEAPVKPAREKVSFDWSNVVDEPHRREIKEIKSPWGTTGSIDEKELYAEMTPSTDRSRTMSFIDVLKAEKEEKERAAADKAIEYTEVLHFDPDLTAFDEPPQLHIAPLYEDVDEPVKTPFDEPEFRMPEPVFEEEPKFEEPVKAEEPEAPVFEEPPAEVSRETIAQFDEYVKSFEREAGISSEPAAVDPVFEEPVYEEPQVSSSKFELPDFLKKITDSFKEPEPEFVSDEPAVIELDEEPEAPAFEEPVFEEPKYEEPLAEEPAEEPVVEEPAEEPAAEPAEEEGSSMEDMYLDLDPSVPSASYEPALISLDDEDDSDEDDDDEDEGIDEDELFREMEESAPKHGMTIAPPADKESEIEALRRRLAELTGTIDKAEIEAAEKAASLEELEEEAPEEAPFDEPADELFEEPEDELFEEPESFEESVEDEYVEDEYEELTFEPEVNPYVDELFAGLTPASQPVVEEEPAVEEEPEPAVEAAVEEIEIKEEPVVEELTFEPEVTPDVDSLFDSLIPAKKAAEIKEEVAAEEPVEDLYLQVDPEEALAAAEETAAAAEEPVAETEPVVEEVPAVEAAVEEIEIKAEPADEEPKKETDALSLEELERDLFGDALTEEVEAEETKKIDKFYTLYRKNEEFQRLLDEEYEKLKHGGGLTEEEKQAVDAIPKMADIEAAKAAAKAAPAAEPEPAPAAPEVPVESQKVYRPVEDETIYMPKELLEEQVKAEAAAAAAAKAPVEIPADKPQSKKEEKKAAKEAAKAARKEKSKVEVEYEDVEKGSKFLTVLAVIIALILIALLAVILILQIAPDSGAAAWIDSLIESITARFSLIAPGASEYLL